MLWPSAQDLSSCLSKESALLTLEESARRVSYFRGGWCGREECHEFVPGWGCGILARSSAGVLCDVDVSEDVLFWQGTVCGGSGRAGRGRRGVWVRHGVEMEGGHDDERV